MYDHVILLSLDTLRSDAIAANPFKLWPQKYRVDVKLATPILDTLAAESAWFVNCLSAAPYTAASHATIFTGQWPVRHGVYEVFNRKLRSPTVFAHVKPLGYRTTFKVDFPVVLGPYLGLNRDADHYIVEDDEEYLATFERNQRSIDFIHFGSMQVPYGFHNLQYGGRDYRDRLAELESSVSLLPSDSQDVIVETFRDSADLQHMVRYKRVVQSMYAAGRYDDLFSLYLEGVNYFVAGRLERFLGRLLELLQGTSYLLVVFGDHGHEYDRESYGHHNSVSEGALRVPLLFYGPDVEPALHATRVRTVDIVPTLLDRLGCEADCDGASLADVVWGCAGVPVRDAFAQVWTTELSAYVEYQRKMLEAGQPVGFLPHVLYSEVLYRGRFRVSQQHFGYTQDSGVWGMEVCSPPKQVLERTHVARYPEPVDDEPLKQAYLERLALYNATRTDEGEPADQSRSLRDQLRAMGYRV